MKYAKLLQAGDTIGVCAPSSGVRESMLPRLDKAFSNVRELGYETIETASVRRRAKCVSADAETRWKSLDGKSNHILEGRMIGGCLDVLCKLLGTRFAPVPAFLERYKSDGFIWTLESCEMSAADIYRSLWQMCECGWFQYCVGVLFGRPDGYSDTYGFTLTDALESGLGGLGVPVIYDVDIGHVPPQIQIINGAYGKIDYNDGSATIWQEMKV